MEATTCRTAVCAWVIEQGSVTEQAAPVPVGDAWKVRRGLDIPPPPSTLPPSLAEPPEPTLVIPPAPDVPAPPLPSAPAFPACPPVPVDGPTSALAAQPRTPRTHSHCQVRIPVYCRQGACLVTPSDRFVHGRDGFASHRSRRGRARCRAGLANRIPRRVL